jgi:hypothetical protein
MLHLLFVFSLSMVSSKRVGFCGVVAVLDYRLYTVLDRVMTAYTLQECRGRVL